MFEDEDKRTTFVRLDREFMRRVKGLGPTARDLWVDLHGRLVAAMKPKKGSGEVHDSIEGLADLHDVSKSTMENAIEKLRINGLLLTEPPSGKHTATRFIPLFPDCLKPVLGENFSFELGILLTELPPADANGNTPSFTFSERASDHPKIGQRPPENRAPTTRKSGTPPPENRVHIEALIEALIEDPKERGEGRARDARPPAPVSDSVLKAGRAGPRHPRLTSLPADFTLSPETRAYAIKNRVDPDGQLEPFKNKALADSWTQGGEKGWQAKFRVWVDTEVRYGRGNFRPPPPNIRDLDRDHISVDPEKAKRARGIVADTLKKMGAAA